VDGPPLGRTSSSPFASSADDDEVYGTVMGISRVVNVDVASWAKWKVISRNAARNACGSVADERNIDNLCATTGCVDTCTFGPWGAVGMLLASNALSSVFFSSMINDNVVLAMRFRVVGPDGGFTDTSPLLIPYGQEKDKKWRRKIVITTMDGLCMTQCRSRRGDMICIGSDQRLIMKL